MKKAVLASVILGSAIVTGCASTNQDPNAIPRIDLDTKVYSTGSRIGRADSRAPEPTPVAPAAPSSSASPAPPAPPKN